ncbi:PTS transporter subunit EIIC [Aliivibrio fischeri]|uniref:PTS system N-acetylmuramic acid-specific EIIBC component n=1 Tax=Aliivibrio fischeri SR5 TaxID=1088719 RepID=A0AAV3EP68_ALIFS|nr:PTS transporter subunit EIIC [Aliivibrio fischeri]EHN68749.1 PTS system IIBC component [Aliivibrio fischeri SR5]
MKSKQLSKDIVSNVGGLNNIVHVTNCMTRVRMTIKDDSKVLIDELKALNGVLGVVNDETLQIIVGPGKSTSTADMINVFMTGIEVSDTDIKGKSDKQVGVGKKILRSIANIFVPILPGLIAAGTIMGINNIMVNSAGAEAISQGITALNGLTPAQIVLQNKGLFELSTALGLIANSLFGLLAIFVGVNSAKEFGGTLILGGMLGAITIAPQVALLGLTPGQGGLIGVIFTVWVMSLCEKKIRNYVPDILDVVVTPTITIIIMSVVLLIAIMPTAGVVSDAILYSLNGLLEKGGLLTGFVLSAIFPFLISLGLHHGLIPIHMELINATGSSQLFAIQIMSNSGMVGAAISVLMLTKDPIMKRVARGAIPTSILAVGEPTIFGVNIPAGFAFITGSIGAGFGGMMIVALDVTTNGVGAAGLSALPLIADGKYLQYIISWLVGCTIAFILTYVIGKYKKYQ